MQQDQNNALVLFMYPLINITSAYIVVRKMAGLTTSDLEAQQLGYLFAFYAMCKSLTPMFILFAYVCLTFICLLLSYAVHGFHKTGNEILCCLSPHSFSLYSSLSLK